MILTGTQSSGTQSSGSTAQNWVPIPQQPVKPIKEIILEASAEQKREQEEESRRRKNIVIHRAPEDNQQGEEERLKEDDELVDSLLCEIELPDLRALVRNPPKMTQMQKIDH